MSKMPSKTATVENNNKSYRNNYPSRYDSVNSSPHKVSPNMKTYNRNWHNNINNNNSNKRMHRSAKTERQVTQICDKDTNARSVCKKANESRNIKCLNERNVESHNAVHPRYYFSNNYHDNLHGFFRAHYFSFITPQYPSNGFYNKQRYYPENQEQCSESTINSRNKRNASHHSMTHRTLVDALMDRFKSRSKFVEIKITPPYLLTGSEWDTLNNQIWNAFITHQQTEDTYRKKLVLWQNLYTFIRNVFPCYGLFLVGSTMSGFGSNTSDVDMCLLVRPTYVDQRSEALSYLEQVQHALKRCGFTDNIELIWAKVPILKFRDASRGLDVDLNCNNAVGIRNTHLLHCYANMDWRVRPLVLLVKLWANANHINAAKNMTISSYSLALMVIHFLQCGVKPPVVPCLHGLFPGKFQPDSDIHTIDMQEQVMPFPSDNQQCLGELLLGFLHYYATFRYGMDAISVRLGARVPIEECRTARSHKNDPHQWKHLCIEEPFDLTNTARSVYDSQVFERIKTVFVHSYARLQETKDLKSIFEFDEFVLKVK